MHTSLADIIREGEGYLVEFKESAHHLEKEICAFANAQGGVIYVGITDSGKIKPVKLTNTLKSQIQSIIRAMEPNPAIEILSHENIVKIIVHESDNKPVKAPQGFFLRAGANSQKLSREEIFSFAIRETRIQFDRQLYIAKEASALVSTRKIEKFRYQAKLDSDVDNLQLLENLGCLKREHHVAYLTHGGILLFTDEPQKIFPQAGLTLLVLDDSAAIAEQKILGGTLFDQVETGFSWLMERLRKKIRIQSLRREEEPEIPEYVLRELLVNAVVHRDYFECSGEIIVKIFPEVLEFSNPAVLPENLAPRDLFGKSYRRNPLLASLFFHAGYIERAGTGLLRVKKLLQGRNLPPLSLSQEGPFFIARLQRGHTAGTEGLTERQNLLFSLPKAFFPFSSRDYAKRFRISERMARLDIDRLLKTGHIGKIRNGRRINYVKKDRAGCMIQ